jgi:hypothetical protein
MNIAKQIDTSIILSSPRDLRSTSHNHLMALYPIWRFVVPPVPRFGESRSHLPPPPSTRISGAPYIPLSQCEVALDFVPCHPFFELRPCLTRAFRLFCQSRDAVNQTQESSIDFAYPLSRLSDVNSIPIAQTGPDGPPCAVHQPFTTRLDSVHELVCVLCRVKLIRPESDQHCIL